MPVDRSRGPPRYSAYCGPGRTSSASGAAPMALLTRHYWATGAVLMLAACAHQPAKKPPEREPIVLPAAPTAPETTVAPPTASATTPPLTLTRDWHHHTGQGAYA